MLQVLLICFLIIAGLVMLVINSNIGETSVLKPYLNELSSLLLITGVLTLLDKIFTQKHQDKKLREIFRIHDSVESMGVKEIRSESQAFNFTELLTKESYLAVVMNDGFRWVGNNSVSLTQRFNTSTDTIIFTLDPNSNFTNVHAGKTDVTVDSLKSKINDTWALLQKLYNESDKKGSLKLYAIKNYPTTGLFLTSERAVFTLYQASSGRTNVPLFVIEKNSNNKSLYSFFKNDLNRLKDEATMIFNSTR
ncbi:hypothetical protein [Paenibacillus rhizophilus]|uniref:Uncharacterized protein n=1 Tax=Paenibacillus rhizophilus TaxID=1850366 RepID=A0A3N9P7M8_9BACL|nr:hypothetical protein [Paenibacillus rhizophilus]RQW12253.1 hypothetical protein EH198_07815 [Paenibacillus rhizophilus]